MTLIQKQTLTLESFWKQLIQKILMGATIVIFLMNVSKASNTEARLHCDSITFKGPKKQIEIEFSDLNEKLVKLNVKIKNKTINIPAKFLYGANHIIVESIRLRVLSPNDKPLWKQAQDKGFCIVLEFGGPYEHGSENNTVDVYQVLFLVFEKGQLVEASISTPLGEYKNEWKIKGIDLRFLDPKEQGFEEVMKNRIRCRWVK